MHLATTPEANALLDRDPLALLVGMLLDQQVPMEKAFTSPAVLAQRMGTTRAGQPALDAGAIAAADPARLEEWFRTPPALHRYPGSMAQRTQALCAELVARYDGDAAQVWAGVESGAELLARLTALPGFGEQKAKIFVALLGKQRGVTPPGWEKAAGDYGTPGFRSVADVVDDATLGKVRAHKQDMKAKAKAARG